MKLKINSTMITKQKQVANETDIKPHLHHRHLTHDQMMIYFGAIVAILAAITIISMTILNYR